MAHPAGPRRFKGVIFDLDGTLINSNIDFPKMKKQMILFLEGNGVPHGLLTPQETNVVILEKAERVWGELGKSEDEKRRIQEEIDRIMDSTELEAIPAIVEVDGASESVRALKKMGYKLAVLTRSHRTYAEEALRKTGMRWCFDFVLGRGETPRPKPYAEALLHTVALMGLDPHEVVFVGDHQIDATCAENASVFFIGVRTGPRRDESWESQKPSRMIDSVSDLPSYLASL